MYRAKDIPEAQRNDDHDDDVKLNIKYNIKMYTAKDMHKAQRNQSMTKHRPKQV